MVAVHGAIIMRVGPMKCPKCDTVNPAGSEDCTDRAPRLWALRPSLPVFQPESPKLSLSWRFCPGGVHAEDRVKVSAEKQKRRASNRKERVFLTSIKQSNSQSYQELRVDRKRWRSLPKYMDLYRGWSQFGHRLSSDFGPTNLSESKSIKLREKHENDGHNRVTVRAGLRSSDSKSERMKAKLLGCSSRS